MTFSAIISSLILATLTAIAGSRAKTNTERPPADSIKFSSKDLLKPLLDGKSPVLERQRKGKEKGEGKRDQAAKTGSNTGDA